MYSAGFKLRQLRARLGLTYRDVEEASTAIATAKRNAEFALNISRLAEIENRDVIPSFYRLYSLCVIYRLDFQEALGWYGLDLEQFAADQDHFQPPHLSRTTHLLSNNGHDRQTVNVPVRLDPGLNLRSTAYLTRMIEAWGTVPLALLNRAGLQNYRYGYVGLEDWMMYPLIPPGSLVQIDTRRRDIETWQWNNEHHRPVYFVEHHNGYACAWCSLQDKTLILQPHPLSPCSPLVYSHPQEAEIVGQVVGVAKQLIPARASPSQPATNPR